jgi:hypothetical protein
MMMGQVYDAQQVEAARQALERVRDMQERAMRYNLQNNTDQAAPGQRQENQQQAPQQPGNIQQGNTYNQGQQFNSRIPNQNRQQSQGGNILSTLFGNLGQQPRGGTPRNQMGNTNVAQNAGYSRSRGERKTGLLDLLGGIGNADSIRGIGTPSNRWCHPPPNP